VLITVIGEKNMTSGKVDIRVMKRSGKYRLRFYSVAEDHLEIIQLALKQAREELGTEYDTVAFEAICLDSLINRSGKFVENSEKFVAAFDEPVE
jgi:hypothetical protein